MTTTTKTAAMEAEAKALANEQVMVATNQGTYGQAEACRKIGTGDPQFANCDIYETVGDAPMTNADIEAKWNGVGRMRIFRDTIIAKRARLTELRRQIRESRELLARSNIPRPQGWA
jgi:hypothetical protein